MSGLIIAIDTREQLPYRFEGLGLGNAESDGDPSPVSTLRISLPTGDYAVLGDSRFAVERKSLEDAYATFGRGRQRFEAELARSLILDQFHLVLEFPFEHDPPSFTSVKRSTVVNSLYTWSVRYGVSVWYAGSRSGGEITTYSLCYRWWRDRHVRERGVVVPRIGARVEKRAAATSSVTEG